MNCVREVWRASNASFWITPFLGPFRSSLEYKWACWACRVADDVGKHVLSKLVAELVSTKHQVYEG